MPSPVPSLGGWTSEIDGPSRWSENEEENGQEKEKENEEENGQEKEKEKRRETAGPSGLVPTRLTSVSRYTVQCTYCTKFGHLEKVCATKKDRRIKEQEEEIKRLNRLRRFN